MHSKKIDLDVTSIDPHWCEDDFYRIFYNILNAGIPPFERYVIKTMREVRDDPRLEHEPRLRELVDIFVRQEIEHTKMHVPVNKSTLINLKPVFGAKKLIAGYNEKPPYICRLPHQLLSNL